jgi:23S rRNA (uracil1939-C5)-methyltransferase
LLKVGQQYLEEQLHNYRFRISSPSFFQVNTLQAEKMVDIVKEKLMLKGGEVLVDAYAGVGTYSALLAPYAGRIYAVEEAASAVADAEVNFSGLYNIVAVKARTEDFLTSFSETIHAIIINPSRSGCQSEVIDVLKARPPERIVYVSCNPRTLARDLKLFCGGPFVIGEIIPVDLFPNTVQVENVVTLMRK